MNSRSRILVILLGLACGAMAFSLFRGAWRGAPAVVEPQDAGSPAKVGSTTGPVPLADGTSPPSREPMRADADSPPRSARESAAERPMAVPPPQAATVTEEALPDEAVFAAKYAQVGVEERRSALEALEALIAEGVAGAASSGRLKGEITALKLEAEWLRAHPDQGSR